MSVLQVQSLIQCAERLDGESFGLSMDEPIDGFMIGWF